MEINFYNNNIKWKLILTYESNLCFLTLKQNNSEIQYSNNFSIDYLISNKIKEINNFKTIIESSIKQNEITIKENKNSINLTLKNPYQNSNELILILFQTKKELKIINYNNIKTIDAYDDGTVTSLSIFPSGNIVSVSDNKSIKIFDNEFNIIQIIKNAHDDSIYYVNVKDENNFATCSRDKNIKTWIKNGNEYNLNKLIINAHNNSIRKIQYDLNGNLISSSMDNTLKIWEEINNFYQSITILTHSSIIFSILLLIDKNILISGGKDGIKIWNYYNYELISYINKIECGSPDSLCRINEDIIIVGGLNNNKLKIISLSEKKIIKEINNQFICFTIYSLNDKEIFLVGGRSNDIKIYKSNNYECVQIIKKAHNRFIKGFIRLNDLILSYSIDGKIKIWEFK